MDLDLLTRALDAHGMPAFRRRQVLRAVTHELVGSWEEITTLPKELRAQLAAEVPFTTVDVAHEERSKIDGSVKLRLATRDGFPLEAVLMRFERGGAGAAARRTLSPRFTACLSSQSGCALACTFCATGKMGLGRNLTRHEIVDQFLELARRRRAQGEGARIDNIVMMGMGEPFHNYDEVLAALRVINDQQGPGIAARRIAISTVGWVPGIERIADEDVQFKLALSLHAPNDDLRNQLMPIANKRYPLERLMRACETYREKTRRRIFIEYLMLEGVNDQPEHARQLAALLNAQAGPGGYHVNLIAYNPTGTTYVGSSDATVRAFSASLERAGIDTSYRVSRARDISGACGQLAAPVADARKARIAERRAARMALPSS